MQVQQKQDVAMEFHGLPPIGQKRWVGHRFISRSGAIESQSGCQVGLLNRLRQARPPPQMSNPSPGRVVYEAVTARRPVVVSESTNDSGSDCAREVQPAFAPAELRAGSPSAKHPCGKGHLSRPLRRFQAQICPVPKRRQRGLPGSLAVVFMSILSATSASRR